MITGISKYFQELSQAVGLGWNRFWFTPREPWTLAVLRLLVGLLATYALITFTPDLVDWFQADGLLTVETVERYRDINRTSFSYLEYLPTRGELLGVHFVGIAITLLFAVGLWTRITSILSLVVMLSYAHRAPMLIGEFDPVLFLLMFYLCLAPCGAVFSVDRWLSSRRKKNSALQPENRESVMATVATRLIQVHFGAVVVMMLLAKLRGEVWWTGEAVWWLSSRTESRLIDVSGTLRGNELFYDAWTHAIVLFEMLFPVLIWNRLARPLLLVTGAVLWTSLGVLSGNLAFAMVLIVASLAYISPEAMQAVLARFEPAGANSPAATTKAV